MFKLFKKKVLVDLTDIVDEDGDFWLPVVGGLVDTSKGNFYKSLRECLQSYSESRSNDYDNLKKRYEELEKELYCYLPDYKLELSGLGDKPFILRVKSELITDEDKLVDGSSWLQPGERVAYKYYPVAQFSTRKEAEDFFNKEIKK